MREIKFRAWDGEKYRYNVGINGSNVYPRCVIDGDIDPLEMMPLTRCTLEQYTGRKDKSGKEIYGGDVCKFRTRLYQVKWDELNTGFCFCRKNTPYSKREDGYCYEAMSIDIWEQSEVVGNIHENPELLNEA